MLFTCKVASHFHVFVFHQLGNMSVFKLFIFTVVTNFAFNKGMYGPDVP